MKKTLNYTFKEKKSKKDCKTATFSFSGENYEFKPRQTSQPIYKGTSRIKLTKKG